MVDPLEELIRQSTEFHSRLIEENNELDRAFQSGTFGQLVQAWSNEDDGGDDTTEDVAGKTSPDVVGSEGGGTGRESETGKETV